MSLNRFAEGLKRYLVVTFVAASALVGGVLVAWFAVEVPNLALTVVSDVVDGTECCFYHSAVADWQIVHNVLLDLLQEDEW